MQLSPTARWLLGGLAAVVTTLTAYDPFGLPQWAQGVIVLLAVLFAALGIVPPQVGGTQQGVVNPSVSESPAADIGSREKVYATGGKTFSLLPAVLLFAARDVSEGEALFWVGVLVVVGCLVAAAVVAYRSRDWIISGVLVLIAIVAAFLLL